MIFKVGDLILRRKKYLKHPQWEFGSNLVRVTHVLEMSGAVFVREPADISNSQASGPWPSSHFYMPHRKAILRKE